MREDVLLGPHSRPAVKRSQNRQNAGGPSDITLKLTAESLLENEICYERMGVPLPAHSATICSFKSRLGEIKVEALGPIAPKKSGRSIDFHLSSQCGHALCASDP